jgi:hypothetical protein
MKIRAFWDIAPYSLEVLPPSSPPRWRQYTPLKRWSTPRLHSAISQKALTFKSSSSLRILTMFLLVKTDMLVHCVSHNPVCWYPCIVSSCMAMGLNPTLNILFASLWQLPSVHTNEVVKAILYSAGTRIISLRALYHCINRKLRSASALLKLLLSTRDKVYVWGI